MAVADGDSCAHDVVFAGMCCQCHRNVSSLAENMARQRPGFLTTSLDLQVSASLLSSLDAAEQLRRASQKKLVLIIDLDHTLVTADVRDIRNASAGLRVRKRPGVDGFLQGMKDTCDMYVYTQATGAYAQRVLQILDPRSSFFGDPPRIFHRGNTPQGLKDLSVEVKRFVGAMWAVALVPQTVWQVQG